MKKEMGTKSLPMLLKGLLLIGLLLAAACGNNASNEGKQSNAGPGSTNSASNATPEAVKDPVNLKFLYIWPEYEAIMNETIRLFEEKNPHIQVEPEIVPWDKAIEVMQTKVAANQAPDVSFGWTHWMAPFVNEVDAAMPLDDYLQQDPAWEQSFIRSDLLDISVVNADKPFVSNIPFKLSFQVVIYNKKMFSDHQLEVPQTREQMEQTMEKLAANGIIPLAASGKDGQIDMLKDSFAGMNFVKNGTAQGAWLAGEESYESPEYIEAMELAKQWFSKGYFGKDAFAVGNDEIANLLLTKRAAMILGNNNQIPTLQEQIDDELGAFLFPAAEGLKIQAPLTADGFFVLKSTQYPDEAVEFLKHLTSEEVQKLWASQSKSMPVLQNLNTGDETLDGLIDQIAASATDYPVQKLTYNPAELSKQLQAAFAEYLLNANADVTASAKKMEADHRKAIESSQ
ncbi:ABC transporter substrate-binding protein [Paenibacillus sp. PAMC21692]|uniref:ABC transporter substrate-binding protein n=1 Tax=Paenibacillus sp. PAMC21692 TaxID=2762320 RepID=UPI00164DF0C9|nr:extracellular solute-binding protein [Paenibacillus sp. PAMC21692]QNK56540.1 extracellular solute-binding protein [Paenibacillus sp. PAMC21692]